MAIVKGEGVAVRTGEAAAEGDGAIWVGSAVAAAEGPVPACAPVGAPAPVCGAAAWKTLPNSEEPRRTQSVNATTSAPAIPACAQCDAERYRCTSVRLGDCSALGHPGEDSFGDVVGLTITCSGVALGGTTAGSGGNPLPGSDASGSGGHFGSGGSGSGGQPCRSVAAPSSGTCSSVSQASGSSLGRRIRCHASRRVLGRGCVNLV